MTKQCFRPLTVRPRLLGLASLFALAQISQPIQAHDFWIQPTSFRSEPGAAVGLNLKAGEHFQGDDLPRNETLQDRFVAVGPEGEAPVPGVHGIRPAGILKATGPGTYTIGYTSHGSVAQMSAATFDRYLEEEGLAAQLDELLPTGRPITDAYSRSAKTLIQVGGESDDGFSTVLGLPFELVPLEDPHRLLATDPSRRVALSLQLLYHDEPAGDVVVRALHRADPKRPFTATTDSDGIVALPIDQPGLWLIKAVRIESAEDSEHVDYRSHWASLTFELSEL